MDKKEILEWAEHYIRHRDLIFRKIKTIQTKQDTLVITNKDDSQEHVVPLEKLEELSITPLSGLLTVVVPNTHKNLQHLLNNWKKFSSHKQLKLIFFNPNSEQEKAWILKPYIHNIICDPKTLKQGLTSMFETVDLYSA